MVKILYVRDVISLQKIQLIQTQEQLIQTQEQLIQDAYQLYTEGKYSCLARGYNYYFHVLLTY